MFVAKIQLTIQPRNNPRNVEQLTMQMSRTEDLLHRILSEMLGTRLNGKCSYQDEYGWLTPIIELEDLSVEATEETMAAVLPNLAADAVADAAQRAGDREPMSAVGQAMFEGMRQTVRQMHTSILPIGMRQE